MPLIEMPVPKRNPTNEELAQTVGEGFEQLGYILNGFLGSMNIKELKADKISAGTILAAVVTIKAALDNGGYLTIDGDGLTANDGTGDTARLGLNGKMVITGGTIRAKASGYPNVVFDSGQNQITATQEDGVSITLTSGGFPGSAQLINFEREGLISQLGMFPSSPGLAAYLAIISIFGSDIKISPGKGLYLNGGSDNIYLESFTRTIDKSSGQSLQSSLNSKANAFSGYTGNITVMTSPTTSITQHFVNGILTSIS